MSDTPGNVRDPRPAMNSGEVPPRIPTAVKFLISGLVAFCVLALVLVLVIMVGSRRPKQAQPISDAGQSTKALINRQVGAAEAKVEVLAVLPLASNCQPENVAFLKSVTESCGEQVRVKFLEIVSEEARMALAERNLDMCATILINGSNRFTTASGREVLLKGPPGEGYQISDVREALQAEMRKAYGDRLQTLPPALPVSTTVPRGADL